MNFYKIFLDFNDFSKSELKSFWEFVFTNTHYYSCRFNNEQIFKDFFSKKNKKVQYQYYQGYDKFISDLIKNTIKKITTNRYLFDKYSNDSIVLVGKVFNSLKNEIFENPNIFNWVNPNYLEDLSFYKDNRIFLYTCSHEGICILFLTKSETDELNSLNKSILKNSFITKININELPKLHETGDGPVS